jgi:hypothetical protein
MARYKPYLDKMGLAQGKLFLAGEAKKKRVPA